MANFSQLIEELEQAWDVDGFLGRLRTGEFSLDDAQEFLALLSEVDLGKEQVVPKRLVSLLWFLPSFLAWQTERVAERCGNQVSYAQFVTEVHNLLEERLGVP